VTNTVRFCDDDGKPIKAVTAEQHAIDNPGHTVHVTYDKSRRALLMQCGERFHGDEGQWWDEQLLAHSNPNPNTAPNTPTEGTHHHG
jgi:hypothetical protein